MRFFIKALSEFIKTKEDKKTSGIAILLTSNEEGESSDGFIDVLLDKLIQRGEKIDYTLVGEPSSSEKVETQFELVEEALKRKVKSYWEARPHCIPRENN